MFIIRKIRKHKWLRTITILLQTHHKIKQNFVLWSFSGWLNSNAKSENHWFCLIEMCNEFCMKNWRQIKHLVDLAWWVWSLLWYKHILRDTFVSLRVDFDWISCRLIAIVCIEMIKTMLLCLSHTPYFELNWCILF